MAYVTVVVEGGLFPADLLERIALGQVEGQRAADFGPDVPSRLSDDIQTAFSDVAAYWDAFQRRRAHSRASLTTLTRTYWVIPLLERLGYALTVQRAAAQVGGESYAISHRAGDGPDAPPVLVVALGQSLDRRAEGTRRSPYALVQEYLNRSDALWGLATDGERLRLLRASARVAGPTYVDFDLRAMLQGNQYSEFVLLYRLLHRSRFPRGAADAPECWLEKYYQRGLEEGGRVRERLRDGVEAALKELGTAFLAHPDSGALRAKLHSGQLGPEEYYRQLLRLVYRLLFLFVVEERRLVFDPKHEHADRQPIYTRHYSLGRLRERCERYFADDHYSDLWQGLLQTFCLFRESGAAGQLGLSALDGELFGEAACADLEGAGCENARLLRAVRSLSTFVDGRVRRRVNYAGLDVEELGSVYESLLDYRPAVTWLANEFAPAIAKPAFAGSGQSAKADFAAIGAVSTATPGAFDLVAGSERRQTGSYYTPPELVRELIDSALVPVMEERLAEAKTPPERAAALLGLRVGDPASGSGHFLLAAARRIGRRLAQIRTAEEEPSPEVYRDAVRAVIRTCVYAVDKNPLAVDLCKVALWIEGHEPGLPLSFLDHHVKCGDSLVGVFDLDVLEQGVPDEAYAAVAGDSKTAARYYRDRNREERVQHSLDTILATPERPTKLAEDFGALATLDDRTPDDVRAKAELYEALRARGTTYYNHNLSCDLWTAAFFAPLRLPEDGGLVPTTDVVRRSLAHPNGIDNQLAASAIVLGDERRFFHWPLEFPEVFARGGFDVVIGNPPFVGGLKISGDFGEKYRGYLFTSFAPAGGVADLCAYFFRRAFSLLTPGGHLGMVATNSIGQGDTREAGLAVIVTGGGTITFARRFIKWPSAANVEVNLVAIRRGGWTGSVKLDRDTVSKVSSRLDAEREAEPRLLHANENGVFICTRHRLRPQLQGGQAPDSEG
ncbi:MAG: hypothetical protein HYY04_11425 [Chloroflexi bacterium]|nr:hypothetical protein [Chloroflexota bacterium]